MQGLSNASLSLPLPIDWFERHYRGTSASPGESPFPGSLNVVLRCAAPVCGSTANGSTPRATSKKEGRRTFVDAVLPDVPVIAIGQGGGKGRVRHVLQVCVNLVCIPYMNRLSGGLCVSREGLCQVKAVNIREPTLTLCVCAK